MLLRRFCWRWLLAAMGVLEQQLLVSRFDEGRDLR